MSWYVAGSYATARLDDVWVMRDGRSFTLPHIIGAADFIRFPTQEEADAEAIQSMLTHPPVPGWSLRSMSEEELQSRIQSKSGARKPL